MQTVKTGITIIEIHNYKLAIYNTMNIVHEKYHAQFYRRIQLQF